MDIERAEGRRAAGAVLGHLCAAAYANWFDRPSWKVSKVRRRSSGEPTSSVAGGPRRPDATRRGPGATGADRRACPAAGADGPAASAAQAGHRSAPRSRSARSDPLQPIARRDVDEVVSVDPAFQEPGRHRQTGLSAGDLLELNATKPAVEDVLPQFGAKPLAATSPGVGERESDQLVGSKHELRRRRRFIEEGSQAVGGGVGEAKGGEARPLRLLPRQTAHPPPADRIPMTGGIEGTLESIRNVEARRPAGRSHRDRRLPRTGARAAKEQKRRARCHARPASVISRRSAK